MRDLLEEIEQLARDGETFAMATVVHTMRSAPRPAGAAMILKSDGSVSGSVSGGCVEGAVYELCEQVLVDGVPRLERFGYSDDEAFAVGLTCGGILDIFVERISAASFTELERVVSSIRDGAPVAVTTIIEHPIAEMIGRRIVIDPAEESGSTGQVRIDEAVVDDARGMLAAGTTGVLTYGPHGERLDTGMRVFVAAHQPRPRLIVFGAIDFAAAVSRAASLVGFHVTVCDARPVFTTAARFPAADDVVVAWPHDYLRAQVEAGRIDRRTVLCILTHDPKFDVPVLELALQLEGERAPMYIGAMGSRATHKDRMDRLAETGLTPAHLERLHSPIGLDLGGRTPEETAVSIIAEVIAERWGGSGARLSDLDKPVHGRAM
ncbi:XdhC family protein [Aeromicrobium sp. P5_D10]